MVDCCRTVMSVSASAPTRPPINRQPGSVWSNRILIAGAVGICFLTLYPFRPDFHRRLPDGSLPFLLGTAHKVVALRDAFLNVVLFVPFGFGLAEKLHERGKSRVATLFLTYAAGALFSYGIEFSQFFIPQRDSGWTDVLTNSTGALAGCLLFLTVGGIVLRFLSLSEKRLDGWLWLRRASVVLSLFWMIAVAASIPLQSKSRLSNWDQNCLLTVANNAAGNRAWKGKVSVLEVWDHAFPSKAGRELTAHSTALGPTDGNLATYEFTGSPPFADRADISPDFSWTFSPTSPGSSTVPPFGREPVLATERPVTKIIEGLRKTNQFSLRVVFTPRFAESSFGDIVSISGPPRIADLVLGQQGPELAFWFETPLTSLRYRSTWSVPMGYVADRSLDVLYSYDGSALSLYLNGKQMPRTYQLGPGVALAQLFRQVEPGQLEACNYIYHALLFLPAGMLLGMAARNGTAKVGQFLIYALLFTAPVVLLELALSLATGRHLYLGNLALSAVLIVVGYLWINADAR